MKSLICISALLFLLKSITVDSADNDRNIQSQSSEIISLTSSEQLLSRKWLDQWPIGNGKFGALVGGSIQGDIIPLSVAGLYSLTQPSSFKQQDPNILHKQFHESRQALLSGNFQEAQKISSLISKSPLGMFQYFGDLTLTFSPFPLHPKDVTTAKITAPPQEAGRRKIWNLHQNIFKAQHYFSHMKMQFQNHALDTKNGIMKSIFRTAAPPLTRPSTSVSKSPRNFSTNSYTRVWYASAVDDVMVGKFQCRSQGSGDDDQRPSSSSLLKNCLHFSLRFGRHVNKKEDLMPESGWDLRRYSSASASSSGFFSGNEISFGNSKIPMRNIYSFHASLTPSPPVYHPDTELCGVVICLPPFSSSSETTPDILISNSPEKSKYLVCNSMKEAHVILSIQISDFNGSNATSANGNGNGLEERCWGRIEKALALGPSQLKKRHATFFNQHTSHSELFLGPSPPSHASSSSPSSIASHLTSLYWFNKYLLLSSSSRSVSNLQGLWSDGPWNPWNSDYHLNINLQMVYWPTYSLGLHRAITSPFIDFIRQVSHSGHLTAKKLYNCDGWVGHGFTDSFLEMGIRGDLQWALCVTCGSWLALSLWDHMIYSSFSLDFTMNTFLPIYRSMIDFYLCYLFQGPDGYVHTGPTTSPENSFTGYLGGKATGRKIVQYLTLSPAIDMSILRQVANAYLIAIQWAQLHLDTPTKTNTSPQTVRDRDSLQQHLIVAHQFTSLIQQMKNSANPIISNSTGLLLEYPTDTFPVSSSTSSGSGSGSGSRKDFLHVDESLDEGHRHFSSFHWLYPGLFHPTLSPALLEASRKTMTKKIQAGGGHTGWSAAWELCLWSRLRQSSSVAIALKKLVFGQFFTRNLFGLHPKLTPNRPNCVTCYGPLPLSQAKGDTDHRGMTTSDGSIFQMDANSGMVAGLIEMLFQSHIPGVMLFLPILLKSLDTPELSSQLSSGRIDRLASRGGCLVSFRWSSHLIEMITLQFNSWHPWFLLSQLEAQPGYFSTSVPSSSTSSAPQWGTSEAIVTLVTPNMMKRVTFQPLGCGEVTEVRSKDIPSYVSLPSDELMHLRVKQFPCEIVICGAASRESNPEGGVPC